MTAHNTAPEAFSEHDTLLPRQRMPASSRVKALLGKFSWEAHPFWLIPVVLVMSMSRGFTMAPRIQVYKAIACRSVTGGSTDLSSLALSPDCGHSDVTARAAKIQASVVTMMSVLSAISTGFWSRLGGTHGRKLILCTFLLGALLMEAVFVLVMRPDSLFARYAEQFILVGPIIEGFVGGLSTFNGVTHAYISDCTRHGSRSTIFSTVQGMIFVGLAAGPWVTGIFLPHTGYDPRFFYGSISLIFGTLLYVMFICPESLKAAPTDRISRPSNDPSFSATPFHALKHFILKFISAVLLPISMFRPRRVPGSRKRNYNVMLCGLAIFLYLTSTGVYAAKYIYAEHVYKWNTAELGYYMSVLWICRAVNLLAFLPIILSSLKPKSTSSAQAPSSHDLAKELVFDQRLAQISLAVDGIADSLVALTQSKSAGVFYFLSCISSFTSGGNPALHSLAAVCMHACGYTADVGTLFGAIGVLSAAAHMISPTLYARTYSWTVAWYPEGIFVVGAVLLFVSVVLLGGLKSSEEDIAVAHTPRIGEEHQRRRSGSSFGYQALPDHDHVNESEELRTSPSSK